MTLREAFEALKKAPTYGWSDEMKEALSLARATLAAAASLTREDADFSTAAQQARDDLRHALVVDDSFNGPQQRSTT